MAVSINDILDCIDVLKKDLRTKRKELEDALSNTEIYRQVRSAKCEVEVSEKDAHKHAINVSLKHYTS
jgi:hypothetical protein